MKSAKTPETPEMVFFIFKGFSPHNPIGYLPAKAHAPIAQWIEQIRPKDEMCVRFMLGAQASAGRGNSLEICSKQELKNIPRFLNI